MIRVSFARLQLIVSDVAPRPSLDDPPLHIPGFRHDGRALVRGHGPQGGNVYCARRGMLDSQAPTDCVGEVFIMHSGWYCVKHGGGSEACDVLGDAEGFAGVVTMGAVCSVAVDMGEKYICKVLFAFPSKQGSMTKAMMHGMTERPKGFIG